VLTLELTQQYSSGCQDSVARVWTKDPSRSLPDSELLAYEKQLSQRAIPKHAAGAVGDLKLDQLPGPEALAVPGTREGEHKMIRNGATAELHHWDSAGQRWVKFGDIVDAADKPSAKKQLNGKSYDYVLDVDLGDGRMAKLGHNASDNPYLSAQNFIHQEMINQDHLEEIARFIMKNTAPVEIGQQQMQDIPYTNSRYIPPAYRNVNLKHIPHTQCVFFETANPAAILTKIKQINTELLAVGQGVAESEMTHLDSVMNKLKDGQITADELQFVFKLLGHWPNDKCFPLIDVLRLLALNESAAKLMSNVAMRDALGQLLVQHGNKNAPGPSQLMVIRFFTNLFRWDFFREFLLQYSDRLLSCAATEWHGKDSLSVMVATLLLNFTVLYRAQNATHAKVQTVAILNEFLNATQNEDAIHRAFAALGNLIFDDAQCMTLAKELSMAVTVSKKSTPKTKEIADELLSLF
jgi:phospholipase A-2-activating protein